MIDLSQAPWVCPVCKEKLILYAGSMRCVSGHCFDIAKNGYVNLLQSSGRGNHGDDRLMVNSRTEFLNGGYYAPLASRVAGLVSQYSTPDSLVLDAGCGEGYYTAQLAQTGASTVAGIDISKQAVAAAAKRRAGFYAAVAGADNIPLPSESAGVLVSIFAPVFPAEFLRVLKPGGVLIRVVPCEGHLWELKETVYDMPYKNPEPQSALPGFTLIDTERLEYTITLPDNASIRRLFMMTPYYYKTSEKDQHKLDSLDTLTTRLEFEIIVSAKPE